MYESHTAWSTTDPMDMAPGMMIPVLFVAWMNVTGLGLLAGKV
jgi:hypothetical protein